MRRTTLLIAVAALSTACLGSDFADSIEGPWQLVSGTVGGEDIPILETHPITITFEGDTVSGTASCNGYGGTYELSGSTITFGDMAMTEMACFPQETMDAEALYAEALTLVDTVAVDEGLTLSGEDVELEFTSLPPVPEADLTNTVWVLDGLIQGDAVSSVSGERATLELFTDGSMLGGTGCRLLTGHYVIRGAEVLLTDLSANGDCDPDLADQDNQVVTVLGDGFRAEVEGNVLTLWSTGGEGLTYVAEQQSALVPLHLWVSNQSFDIDPVDIVITVDGQTVVDQAFEVGDRHGWVPFELTLNAGPHLLRAAGNSGRAEQTRAIDLIEERWVVVDFGFSPVDEPNQFTISVHEGPIGFM